MRGMLGGFYDFDKAGGFERYFAFVVATMRIGKRACRLSGFFDKRDFVCGVL